MYIQYEKIWTPSSLKSTKKYGNANTALEEIPITHRIIVTIVMTERLSSTLWVKQTKIYFISLFTNDDGVKYRETQGYLSILLL